MKFKLPEDDIFVTILFVIPVNGENRGRPYFSIRFSSKANQTCDISLEQIYTKDKVEKVYKLMNETVLLSFAIYVLLCASLTLPKKSS